MDVQSNCSISNASLLLFFVAWMAVVLAETNPDDSGCGGGTCPIPTMMSASGAPNNNGVDKGGNTGGTSKEADAGCGLWMGPSPIKQAEDHGFGLGIFTGKVRRYICCAQSGLRGSCITN
jgi:hypothetical protein